MRKISVMGWVLLVIVLTTTPIFAANTASVLQSAVCINEVLADPNSASDNFDTDGNGTADTLDEFVEIYNLSGSDIDISGWQLWDDGTNNWFTFPGVPSSGTTVLKAYAYAVVVVGVQTGGSLPTMTNPDSLAFDALRTDGVLNNGGDNVVLYDPVADQYIQILYNDDAPDIPPVDYAGDGFSGTATLVGNVEDFGSDADGKSLTRYPSGDTNVVVHDAIPGVSSDASPNAVTVSRIHSRGLLSGAWAIVAVCTVIGWVILKRRG
jgi:hypothetical protein